MAIDFLFGKDEPHAQYDNVVCVRTVYDNVQLAMVESVLIGEKIPYLLKERGAGSSVKIITGFSLYGTDIFVDKKDEERAREVLNALLDADAEMAEEALPEEKEGDFSDDGE